MSERAGWCLFGAANVVACAVYAGHVAAGEFFVVSIVCFAAGAIIGALDRARREILSRIDEAGKDE